MTQDKQYKQTMHNAFLENRAKLTLTDIVDVDSFDECTIIAITSMGELTVTGYNLHIVKLSVDSGEMKIEGTINSLTYSDRQQTTEGFFKRLFR